MPPTDLEQSKAFRRFKADLIRQIPRVPNDRASREALQAKSPTELLIVYLCWQLRLVAPRPRTVTGHHRIWQRPTYLRLSSNVQALLRVVEAGGDLNPYLSLKAHRHGFVLDGAQDSSSWEHKDFLLNVMGLHHFHLGTHREQRGHMARTNEVLFAFVSPDTFEILGLFDHSVFEADEGMLTDERERIWSTYEDYQLRRTTRGGFYIGGYAGLGITAAGTPTVVTMEALTHVDTIKRFDPCLHSARFLKRLWTDGDVPSKPKLRWHYRHLTLGLVDATSGAFFALPPPD